MTEAQGVNKVEAVLFASGRAMEEEHIKELTSLKPEETKNALETLRQKYHEAEGALFIWNEGTKWKINVKEDYVGLVKTLAAETELTRQVLETLAIIAYRTPVLQSEIITSRGEGAYSHINELVERGFITKEKFGRSYKLKIAEKFYHYFDVAGDKDIREALAQAKQPDPQRYAAKEQQKLGALDIVNALSDAQALERQRKETQLEIYEIGKQREEDKRGFLNGFEHKLSEARQRIGEAEEHILKEKASIEEAKAEEGEPVAEEESKEDSIQATEEPEEKPSPEPEEDVPEYEGMDPQELAKRMEEEADKLSKEDG